MDDTNLDPRDDVAGPDPSDDDAGADPSDDGSSPADEDALALFARARAGDEGSLVEFVRRYEFEVRTVVRSRLPRLLRSRFDSMDFVQAVWTSVLSARGRELRFDNARHLMGYLAGVARNKVIQEHRRQTTQKYDIARETPLYTRRGGREVPHPVASHEPTPSQALQVVDRLDRMAGAGDALVREVLELRRTGMTYEEIGRALNLNESRARRIIDEVWRREERR